MADARQRLELLYELAKQLASLHDADEMLHHAMARIAEIFAAEGCSILLLDEPRHEFYFYVTAQGRPSAATDAQLHAIRFPAGEGIAGWILEHERGVFVPDTASDERFYSGVDNITGMSTQRLLGAPLKTVSGVIGVVEVVNPQETDNPDDDVAFLEALAADLAVAYEKADLQRRMAREMNEMRQFARIGGILGLVVGGLMMGGTMFAHLARALPMSQALLRPAFAGGLLVTIAGFAMLRGGRRR